MLKSCASSRMELQNLLSDLLQFNSIPAHIAGSKPGFSSCLISCKQNLGGV